MRSGSLKLSQALGFLSMSVLKVCEALYISQKSQMVRSRRLLEATGRYRVGSVHKARVIGYNAMDGLFIISMESKIIDQPFLRMEDVNVGQVVKGTVENSWLDLMESVV